MAFMYRRSEEPVSNRILNEFDAILKEYLEEDNKDKLGKLGGMLNMMDPEHSIILNNTLGLLGDGPVNDYDGILVLNNRSDVVNQPLRGNAYDIVTEDGLTINYKVDHVGVLIDNGKTVAYVFGLFGKRATLIFDSFFGELNDTVQAYVLWDMKDFYINNAVEKNLKEEFIFEPTLEVGKLAVEFKGARYIYRKNLAHNISIYDRS